MGRVSLLRRICEVIVSRRRAHFSEADARRACKAAPDRTVEIILPDGTVIRMIPGTHGENPQLAKERLAVEREAVF